MRLAQLLDRFDFLFRHEVTLGLGQPDTFGDRIRHRLVIARDHDQPLDPEGTQLGHDLRRNGSRGVHDA
ncbi:hypothetical protein D9M73_126500 [compost metagenome]